MTIRINHIRVNRNGPLSQDFELAPGDLNLIYGRNETGKTYVVECLIQQLFRAGRRSPLGRDLRGWTSAGRIIVTGLGEQPETFDRHSRKLDDYWAEDAGLPRDLSRMLVVRAGDTSLAADSSERDGVGRGILKDYLTGGGLLDEILESMQKTVRDASVEEGAIRGASKGELEQRDKLREELRKLDGLLRKVEEAYASGEMCALRQEKEQIEAQMEHLNQGKRFLAWQLQHELTDLRAQRENLPNETELVELQTAVGVYEEKTKEAQRKAAHLQELETTDEDYRWTKAAAGQYAELMGQPDLSHLQPLFMILALLSLAAAAVTAVLLSPGWLPTVGCVALAALFLLLHFVGARKAVQQAGPKDELQALKAEFERRFGAKLTGKPALEAECERLNERHITANKIREDLERLDSEMALSRQRIATALEPYCDNEASQNDWRSTLEELRLSIGRIDEEITSTDRRMALLSVSEEHHLTEDPGVEWDHQLHDALQQQLNEVQRGLNAKLQEMDLLRGQLASETRLESLDWEELIFTLGTKRERVAGDYKGVTARILAKIQVTATVNEFRAEENARIAAGLERQELLQPLRTLTRRYGKMRLDEDKGLILISEFGDEYPLAEVSTGAQEQAYLALRTGFASLAMQDQTAFLILDDAFQHSDWERRENLVSHTVGLVSAGWQVFYFTMDDHIRDLFLKAGEPMGEAFKCVELS
ncbi:MAG: hypothetical protein H8D43_04730 [Chloroflexi bacterium]|nr:hypothetical protein [Chloroflexota bacterium]